MPLMWRTNTLHMQWCVDCHRNPEPHLRPRDQVFSMEDWPARPRVHEPDAEDAPEETAPREKLDLVDIHQIANETDCSVCHR